MLYQFLFAGLGLLFVAVGLPLSRRRVPPNRWYGLRVRATLADETIWYEANAVSGRELVWFGVAFTLLALGLPLLVRLSEPTYALTCAAVLVVTTLVLAVRGWRLAARLEKAKRGAA